MSINEVEPSKLTEGLNGSGCVSDDVNTYCAKSDASVFSMTDPCAQPTAGDNGWTTIQCKRKLSYGDMKKRKKAGSSRSLYVNPTAYPRLSQLHALIAAAVYNHQENKGWFQLSGTCKADISSCLVVVIPYLSKTILDQYVNQTATPFLHARRGQKRSVKKQFFRGTSRSCSLLKAILDGGACNMNLDVKRNAPPRSFPESPCLLKSLLLTEDDYIRFGFPTQFSSWVTKINHRFHTTLEPQVSQPAFPLQQSEHRSQHNVSFFTSEKLAQLYTDPDVQQLVGLDCEMCLTEEGKEVVRVSVVRPRICPPEHAQAVALKDKNESEAPDSQSFNSHNGYTLTFDVLLDTLVKPKRPVLDYLTRYSGVTQQHLETVTVTLEDVQHYLSQIITPETILVGHSLENDLTCLQISHPKIIDTGVIYKHRQPFQRHSLKHLAYTHLNGLVIQRAGKRGHPAGHDSVEDAIVPIQLALLKSLSPLSATEAPDKMCEPLGKRLEKAIDLYDVMVHDLETYPLSYLAQNVRVKNVAERSDAGVVRSCVQELLRVRQLSSKTEGDQSETVDSYVEQRNAALYLCFLREYQMRVHESIGGVQPMMQPSDVYNISKRVSQWISMCLTHASALPSPSSTSSPSNTSSVDLKDVSNWLETAQQSMIKPTDSPSATCPVKCPDSCLDDFASFASEQDDDVLGKSWCESLIKNRPVKHPDALFPPMADKTIKAYMKELDANLALLHDSLDTGSVMIIVSACGNPIRSLGLARLQRHLSQLVASFPATRAALNSYISFNTSFSEAQIDGDVEFNNAFCYFTVK